MITVYSKKSCPGCDQAKKFLWHKGVQYEEIKVDEVADAREFLLAEGHRSVPQFYKNGALLATSVEQLIALPEDAFL